MALVAWVLQLRVRCDVHGRFYVAGCDGEGRTIVRNYTAHSALDWDGLHLHFSAQWPDDIRGVHVMSPDERCRTTFIDIDRHGEDGADPKTNRRFAKHVYCEARALGFDCLLFDSNGRGGYHIWIVHGETIPGADAYRLGRWLIRDHARFGLDKAPEAFPKSPRHTCKRIGGWVRLPGRHPKHDHYTRVWDDEYRVWLEGDAAIRAILRVEGKVVDVATVVPPEFTGARPVRPARTRATRRVGARHALPARRGGPEHRRAVALAEAALRYLGPDYFDDYGRWLSVGMAVAGLGDDGLRLWHSWSSPSSKYDPEVLDAKWASFADAADPAAGNLLGLGSLFRWALDEGWTWPDDGPGRRRRRRRGSISIHTQKKQIP